MSTGPTIRSIISETLAERIRELGERYGVQSIRIFGSFARGDARDDSDIDFVVEYVPGKGGFAFVDFCEEVEKLLGRKVDVVTEKSLPPSIRDQVLAQAIRL
jgi:predicted nucleotidyltransferase